MNLVIDIGNTQAKVAVFNEKGNVVAKSYRKDLSLDIIADNLQRHTIKNAIIASVRNDNEEMLSIKKLLMERCHFVNFTAETPVPIEIHYLDKETLGLDRIAAAVGCWKKFPNQHSLVIIAGTCLVTNFIHKDGAFIGGSIAPGVDMRLKAMHHFTEKLPLVEKVLFSPVISNSTDYSLISGAVYGTAYEIDGIINYYKSIYNNVFVVLAGGDAFFLGNSIKNRIFADPELVLFGLNEILNTNV